MSLCLWLIKHHLCSQIFKSLSIFLNLKQKCDITDVPFGNIWKKLGWVGNTIDVNKATIHEATTHEATTHEAETHEAETHNAEARFFCLEAKFTGLRFEMPKDL